MLLFLVFGFGAGGRSCSASPGAIIEPIRAFTVPWSWALTRQLAQTPLNVRSYEQSLYKRLVRSFDLCPNRETVYRVVLPASGRVGNDGVFLEREPIHVAINTHQLGMLL